MMRALLLTFLLAAGASAQTREPVPVLVELFTSEGCNSCPPADRILEVLLKEQPIDGVQVVGMSEHVTYWDHQGWKDPFGSVRFTQRQNAYGSRFKIESVFTPQMVVDGATQFAGTDLEALKRALADAGTRAKPPLTVSAAITEKGVTGTASGAGLEAGGSEEAELLWALTEDNLVVDVKRGENAKRTLRHSGVTRHLLAKKIEAGQTSVASPVMPLKPEWKRENLRLIAFVQSTKTRRVLSVGWADVTASR